MAGWLLVNSTLINMSHLKQLTNNQSEHGQDYPRKCQGASFFSSEEIHRSYWRTSRNCSHVESFKEFVNDHRRDVQRSLVLRQNLSGQLLPIPLLRRILISLNLRPILPLYHMEKLRKLVTHAISKLISKFPSLLNYYF